VSRDPAKHFADVDAPTLKNSNAPWRDERKNRLQVPGVGYQDTRRWVLLSSAKLEQVPVIPMNSEPFAQTHIPRLFPSNPLLDRWQSKDGAYTPVSYITGHGLK
jgi:hypothetical protein